MDERFNPWQVIQAAEDAGAEYGPIDRLLLQYIAVPALKEALIFARHRLRFLDREVAGGPGRFDTFNPLKALLNWPQDLLPRREMVGIVEDVIRLLEGVEGGYRAGRLPDPKAAKPTAKLLRGLADELEL